MQDTMPGCFTRPEVIAYRKAAGAASALYLKRNGSPAVSNQPGDSPEKIAMRLRTHAAEWHAAHDAARASKAHAAGMSAVKRMHNARVSDLATMTAPGRVGGPATGVYLAHLESAAAHAVERLAVLASLTGKPVRKSAARKAKPVAVETVAPADIVAAAVESGHMSVASVSAPVTPAHVPADVQTYPQMRAARKASRRELAAKMRAAGIHPNGEAWRLASSGVDLADIPAVLAGAVAIPEGVSV